MLRLQRIHLKQHTVEIQDTQQLLEGCAFAGFTSVVSLLGKGDAECSGVHRDLGGKAVGAVLRLSRRAWQRFAVSDQLVQTLCATRNLADHPGLQHLANSCR